MNANEVLIVWVIGVLRDERYFIVNGVILGVVREKKNLWNNDGDDDFIYSYKNFIILW